MNLGWRNWKLKYDESRKLKLVSSIISLRNLLPIFIFLECFSLIKNKIKEYLKIV